MLLSTIIPTLNEADTLPHLLDDLQEVTLPLEVIVADGGSADQTTSIARAQGARVVDAQLGRGIQLNAGAAQARGSWLLFLHADVRVPEAARSELAHALERKVDAAVWSLAIDAGGLWPRVMEFGARVRDRLGGLPYGDQGLFVRRQLFEETGGFPEVPIMEDVAMVRSLRKLVRLERLPAPLLVSPRRWQRQGPYRTWLRNSALITAYHLGVSPQRLARWYRADVR